MPPPPAVKVVDAPEKIVTSELTLAVGLGLALTNTVVVFEHPVDELVTVNEYTPAAFTVAELVVAPAVMPAPDQL